MFPARPKHRESQHHLVPLPTPLAQFRSAASHLSPFETLAEYLAVESGAPRLAFSDISLSRSDFASLAQHSRVWSKRRAGGPVASVRPGVTAPLISSYCPDGHALVAELA